MSVLKFKLIEKDGASSDKSMDFSRGYNLGFTMRDEAKMQAHLEECYKLGIKELICERPPLVMPISSWAVLTDTHIGVQRPKTSGEVEIVTIVDENDEIFVSVGSDHTDRSLETIDIPWSKQVAPNVVAPQMWRWNDVKDHWDDIHMESWVIDQGETVKYQEAMVNEFWTPAEMVQGLRDSVVRVPGANILFSGTVVSIGEKLRFAESWTIKMTDPVLNRVIEHTYTVDVLAREVLNDGSASGDVAKGEALTG